MSRRIRARPGNHWHTPVSGLGRDTDEATVFDHTQRRRFAGSTGDDERGDALSNLPFTEASKGLFVNAVALERCRSAEAYPVKAARQRWLFMRGGDTMDWAVAAPGLQHIRSSLVWPISSSLRMQVPGSSFSWHRDFLHILSGSIPGPE